MKKTLISLVAILLSIILIPVVKADEKVPVYMITKEGCPACESALEYFDKLEKENPDLFDLIVLEVFDSEWNFRNDDLKNLFIKVYERFDEDAQKAATPTIIIGDYHSVGLPKDTSIIKNEITSLKDSEEKVDEVKKIADELEIDIEKLKTEKTSSTSGKYDALIVAGIFIVLIGGFAGLIIASKK